MTNVSQTAASFAKRLKKQIKVIGRERDKLREIADEAEEIIGDYDEAIDAIERAIETMSELT